jgi:hypothetical protein
LLRIGWPEQQQTATELVAQRPALRELDDEVVAHGDNHTKRAVGVVAGSEQRGQEHFAIRSRPAE